MKETLYLTLNKKAFDVMVTGEKKNEFRKNSKWIESRLIDKHDNMKHYKIIKFTNGYGSDKPYFICDFVGSSIQSVRKPIYYSNGLCVEAGFYYLIRLGNITERGNI